MTRGLTVRMRIQKSPHSSHMTKRRETSTVQYGADESGANMELAILAQLVTNLKLLNTKMGGDIITSVVTFTQHDGRVTDVTLSGVGALGEFKLTVEID